jgi:3-oxoacyl-[acyl-carrier-protein] synthase II
MTRQVVVTGLGMTSPVGGDVASSWQNVLAGVSGISVIEAPWADVQPSKIAGFMAVDPAEVLDRVEARKLDRSQQAALVAAREAWADAGSPQVDPERLGAVIATGMGGLTSLMNSYDTLLERGPSRISPHMVTQIMPNGSAAIVGLEVGARAGVHTPVSACASGAEAVSYAARMIQTGRADVVICGGTEAVIHPITMAGFGAMRALSTRNDDPTAASRPYDIDRDGFVMGEGAGVLVLESAEFAAARGATVIGIYGGSGLTSDGHHIAQPDPEGHGAARAMTLAVEDAGLTMADVVHVNAHATSTPQGDIAESVAIRGALGSYTDSVVITGTKSMTGHLLGGAGAIESIFTLLSLRDRLVPPTANLHSLDPAVNLDVAAGAPRALPDGDIAAINNSFGFGGHDVALVFRSA